MFYEALVYIVRDEKRRQTYGFEQTPIYLPLSSPQIWHTTHISKGVS